MLIDSHAHLTSDAVYDRIDEILRSAQEAGIEGVMNICTDAKTLERGLVLARKFPWVYNVASTTPHDIDTEGEILFPVMEKHARKGDLVAIGETGLDYYQHRATAELQKHFLKRYLHLALDCHLPVVIHCRDAFADFFPILDSDYMSGGKHGPGVLHCFTGNEADAAEVIARGWYLSVSGIVTYKKSDTLRAVAKTVPLDRLLIETDTPYLAPQRHRGQVNQPAFLRETAATIASIRGISIEELAKATSDNARRLFLKQV